MRVVDHHGIHLSTEAFGNRTDPAVLLIMGATASMLGWPDDLCTAMAGHGLHVIRFDHRDTGQSTSVPPGTASYAVEDMAADAIAILETYGLDRAHLVGMSLGGYIAQMLAVTHRPRTASLTLIGSEPLGWDGAPLPHISDAFLAHFDALGTLDWADTAAVADFLVEIDRLCAGPQANFDADFSRAQVRRVLARAILPASMFNHAAVTTRDDWTGCFRRIDVPVLVVHGQHDPVLPLPNGQAIADALAGSAIHILPKVGHALPPDNSADIAARIAAHIRQAEH